jgi:2-phosphosulfolactate phosphatase
MITSINLGWGLNGINHYKKTSDVIIIVDVLSFSTCVDIAVNNEAEIIPYRFKEESVVEYAKQLNAQPASLHRIKSEYSLSPVSLQNIKPRTRLVLSSPNGSELSLSAGNALTLCGCLRNAEAVGRYASKTGNNITIIPAGEKNSDGSLRPAVEDLIGAGAILRNIYNEEISPECETAIAVYEVYKENLLSKIKISFSGKELIERGFEEDVILASQLNVSKCVPVLKNGVYKNLKV